MPNRSRQFKSATRWPADESRVPNRSRQFKSAPRWPADESHVPQGRSLPDCDCQS